MITLVTAKDALPKPVGLTSQLDQASDRMRLEVKHSQPQVGGLSLQVVTPACESVRAILPRLPPTLPLERVGTFT